MPQVRSRPQVASGSSTPAPVLSSSSTLCAIDIGDAFSSHSPVRLRTVDICAAFLSHSPVYLRTVDICAAFSSHSPVHLCMVDICAAFLSHSPFHLRTVDICAAFSSHSPVHLCPDDICAAFSSHSPVFVRLIFVPPSCHIYLSNFMRCTSCQESSLTRRGWCPLSPPGQCIVWGGEVWHNNAHPSH
jgi:hypothetical protein